MRAGLTRCAPDFSFESTRLITPSGFYKQRAFVSAVGIEDEHSPGEYDEQWNH